MTVSIWCKLSGGRRLPGTSKDWSIFEECFGRRLSARDEDKLIAMHRTSGAKDDDSLWRALADEVGRLGTDETLDVWAEW